MNLLTSKNHSNSLSLSLSLSLPPSLDPLKKPMKAMDTLLEATTMLCPSCSYLQSLNRSSHMFTLSLSHTHPQEKTTLSPAPSLSYFSPANLWTQGFHTNTSFCLSPTNHQDMHDSKTIFQTNKEARPREESEGRELKTVGWLPPLVRLRLAVSSSLPVAVAVSVCVRLRLTTYGQSGTLCQHC